MTTQSPTHKQLQVDKTDWETYNKLSKAMTKVVGVKVYTNGAVKLAVQEFISNHPEYKL